MSPTESKLAMAHLPQSCKGKPRHMSKIDSWYTAGFSVMSKDLVSVHLGIFYMVFRDWFFFCLFLLESGLKECSQSAYTYMKCKFEH